MAEKVCECKILLVHYVCDKCSNGVMRWDRARFELPMLMSDPPQYPHKCEYCGHTEGFTVQYPYQTFVPIEPLRDREEGEE